MNMNLADTLDRHKFAQKDRDELQRRLNDCSSDELRGMLLLLAARLPQAFRLVQAATTDEQHSPRVDAQQIRDELQEAFAPVRGAFGKPASRGDYAIEATVTEIARCARDYEASGHLESARTIYRVVSEELDANQHMLNPHRGWHHDLDDVLARRIADISDSEVEKPRRRYPNIERQLGLDEFEDTFTFDTLVEVFVAKSWDGHYYSSFAIDSKNFRHIPAETQNWFDLLARMLDEAIAIADRQPRNGLAHLERLIRLYKEALPSDRVVFAGELGEWMIPTDYQAIVDRYIELIPQVHSGGDMLVAFDPVSHELTIAERVDFFLEHGFRDEAAAMARRAWGRNIDKVVDVLKAHGETALANELADKRSDE